MDIIITWPKRRTLESYLEELGRAEIRESAINYRVPSVPKKINKDDRCFITYDGIIRGYNYISGVYHKDDVVDPITGEMMAPGFYIERDPAFFPINPLYYPSFRGYRYFDLHDHIVTSPSILNKDEGEKLFFVMERPYFSLPGNPIPIQD